MPMIFNQKNETMVDFTVAIPTYNGAARLPEVLDCLRSQIHTQDFSWEIIVVDNNSSDTTATVVQTYQANWPQAYPLKYCFEPQQGAAFARKRAIETASGNLVGFLDDDNLPEPDWVAKAYEFGQAHPEVGAYGSRIKGDFEVEPPEEFKRIAFFLAIIDRGSQAHLYEPRKKMLPASAGLVVSRQAWLESVPNRPFLTGRTAQSWLTSEDVEALVYIQMAGWDIWYNPDMCIHHKIPRQRLERDYLISLVRGIGLARHHIRMMRIPTWQRPLIFPICIIKDLQKVISHFFKYRPVLKTDLAAACEMEFLLSTLVSPFYLWKTKYLDSWLKLTRTRST
jgi:glycosyltransferase involved in cell wall biosynthesis